MNIFHRIAFSSFLEEDEKIKKVFRQPFLFLLKRVVFRVIVWGSLAFLIWFFAPTVNGINLGLVALAFVIVKVLLAFCVWYVNAILMTTEGLLFIDWPKFFEKRFQRLYFSQLDTVTVEKIGVNSFFINFGTLVFLKIGGDEIRIKKINAPNWVARRIESFRERMLDEKNFTEESALKDLISQLVRTHVGENGQPEREDLTEEFTLARALKKEKKKKRSFFKKKKKPRFEDLSVDIEKSFDDEGGIEIDLDEDDDE